MMSNNYVDKDLLKAKFTEYLEQMPHDSSLCSLLVDLMMNKAEEKVRPELLQLIVEKFQGQSSMCMMPAARYKVNVDISLMEEYREKVDAELRKLISSAGSGEIVKTKVDFYGELYNYVFENEMFFNEDLQAYVLFLCCKNPMLPYCEIDIKDFKIIGHLRNIEEEIGVERLMKVNFILNHPTLNCFQKVDFLNKEIEDTPTQSQDLLINHIVHFYESSLKVERVIRELKENIKELKKEMTIGYSVTNPIGYGKKNHLEFKYDDN